MPTFLKKTMVYLGLLDDEYDEYDDYHEYRDYESQAQRGWSGTARADARGPAAADLVEDDRPDRGSGAQVGRIRTLPREGASVSLSSGGGTSRVSPVIRPMSAGEAARVQVVAPTRFGDAKEIADYLKGNRPVIVNLQVAERDLQRRMIDFCSGVTYALSGEMEKVADEVFLLTPTNVKVSEEERQRLQERGFGRS